MIWFSLEKREREREREREIKQSSYSFCAMLRPETGLSLLIVTNSNLFKNELSQTDKSKPEEERERERHCIVLFVRSGVERSYKLQRK